MAAAIERDRGAFTAADSGAAEVYVAPYLGSASRVQVSDGGRFSAAWDPTGDRLYYIQPRSFDTVSGTSAVMVVDLSGPNARIAPAPSHALRGG